MKPFTIARSRGNLLLEAKTFGAEMRSASRLLGSHLQQELDLSPDTLHAYRLEFEIDEETGAPCLIALFPVDDGDEEDEDDLDEDDVI